MYSSRNANRVVGLRRSFSDTHTVEEKKKSLTRKLLKGEWLCLASITRQSYGGPITIRRALISHNAHLPPPIPPLLLTIFFSHFERVSDHCQTTLRPRGGDGGGLAQGPTIGFNDFSINLQWLREPLVSSCFGGRNHGFVVRIEGDPHENLTIYFFSHPCTENSHFPLRDMGGK